MDDIPPNAANVLGPLEDTTESVEQTLIESNIEESDQMNTKDVEAIATEYFALTPGDKDKDEPVHEVDSDGTNNTKDKERSSRWK